MKFDIGQKLLDEKEPLVPYSNFNEQTLFVDFLYIKKLFDYYFFVSGELMGLFEIYDETIEFIPYFITTKGMDNQVAYWRVILPQNDFLVKGPGAVKESQLNKDLVKNKHIFLIKFQKQEYICVSLHLAENMLRKFFFGINYTEIGKEGAIRDNRGLGARF